MLQLDAFIYLLREKVYLFFVTHFFLVKFSAQTVDAETGSEICALIGALSSLLARFKCEFVIQSRKSRCSVLQCLIRTEKSPN